MLCDWREEYYLQAFPVLSLQLSSVFFPPFNSAVSDSAGLHCTGNCFPCVPPLVSALLATFGLFCFAFFPLTLHLYS
jgi:hypothetical protein